MLEDYLELLNTGKQLVVGLSRIPEGKCENPNKKPANCRVNIYKVLDSVNYKKNSVYHLEYVGHAGAIIPYETIDFKRLRF